jgi:hypothetical protein
MVHLDEGRRSVLGMREEDREDMFLVTQLILISNGNNSSQSELPGTHEFTKLESRPDDFVYAAE